MLKINRKAETDPWGIRQRACSSDAADPRRPQGVWDNLPCAREKAVEGALRLDQRRDQPDLGIANFVVESPANEPVKRSRRKVRSKSTDETAAERKKTQ